MLSEFFFASRAEASAACAGRLRAALGAALAQHDTAAIVLSGGSSPAATLQQLALAELPWDRVTVTLSDERWVAATHKDSNEKMLRDTLLVNNAANAKVLSLYRENVPLAAATEQIQRELQALPLPFASVLLGMGEDGHFASLFPDFDGLSAALQEDSDTALVAVSTAASPHPRISMTLSALLQSKEIILLIFGDAKRQVYEDAKATNNKLPVARLLAQARVPLHVIWAP